MAKTLIKNHSKNLIGNQYRKHMVKYNKKHTHTHIIVSMINFVENTINHF